MLPAIQRYVARYTALYCPRYSVILPSDTALCCPAIQRYVAQRYSVMFPAIQRYVARGDIWNVKTFFNPFPGTSEVRLPNNFVNLQPVYFWRHYVTSLIRFTKMCQGARITKEVKLSCITVFTGSLHVSIISQINPFHKRCNKVRRLVKHFVRCYFSEWGFVKALANPRFGWGF